MKELHELGEFVNNIILERIQEECSEIISSKNFDLKNPIQRFFFNEVGETEFFKIFDEEREDGIYREYFDKIAFSNFKSFLAEQSFLTIGKKEEKEYMESSENISKVVKKQLEPIVLKIYQYIALREEMGEEKVKFLLDELHNLGVVDELIFQIKEIWKDYEECGEPDYIDMINNEEKMLEGNIAYAVEKLLACYSYTIGEFFDDRLLNTYSSFSYRFR